MRGIFLACSFAVFVTVNSVIPASAAGSPSSPGKPDNWQQHDAAVYVVSTLNLLRLPTGQTLADKLNAGRFDVYADLVKDGLYFIQMRTKDGVPVALVAYQMGWLKPMSMSRNVRRLGVAAAPRSVFQSYRTDHKQLVESFTSTLPGQ